MHEHIKAEAAALRRIAGHSRFFNLTGGRSGHIECATFRIAGRFIKFLWVSVYDAEGNEVVSACKVHPQPRFRSSRFLPCSWIFEQVMAAEGYRPNSWIRVQFPALSGDPNA